MTLKTQAVRIRVYPDNCKKSSQTSWKIGQFIMTSESQ